jgi:hypothetical protein
MAKLVYIGGFGRSGSTLLEYLLTCDPNLVACGEVARHVRRFRTQKACTCGRPAKECPVWGPFQLGRKTSHGLDHQALTLAMFKQVSTKFNIMVDSSKTAWGSSFMPFRFRGSLGPNFLLVHLVRDPRAVCWSTIRSLDRVNENVKPTSPLVRCLRTAIGWTAANLACEIFGLLHPQNYVRVRYEDLVQIPRQVIEQIFGKLSSQCQLALEKPRTEANRHQLYGNVVRFKPLSLSTLKEETAWKSAMPRAYRQLAALTWPLAVQYGYFRAPR